MASSKFHTLTVSAFGVEGDEPDPFMRSRRQQHGILTVAQRPQPRVKLGQLGRAHFENLNRSECACVRERSREKQRDAERSREKQREAERENEKEKRK